MKTSTVLLECKNISQSSQPDNEMIGERYHQETDTMETLLSPGDTVETFYYERENRIVILFSDFSKCEIIFISLLKITMTNVLTNGMVNYCNLRNILTNGNIPWQKFKTRNEKV